MTQTDEDERDALSVGLQQSASGRCRSLSLSLSVRMVAIMSAANLVLFPVVRTTCMRSRTPVFIVNSRNGPREELRAWGGPSSGGHLRSTVASGGRRSFDYYVRNGLQFDF